MVLEFNRTISLRGYLRTWSIFLMYIKQWNFYCEIHVPTDHLLTQTRGNLKILALWTQLTLCGLKPCVGTLAN